MKAFIGFNQLNEPPPNPPPQIVGEGNNFPFPLKGKPALSLAKGSGWSLVI